MYRGLLEHTQSWPVFKILGSILMPPNSFIIAIPYCIIGKYFADHPTVSIKHNGLLLLFSLSLGVLEVYFCRNIKYITDVFLSLLLICPCIFYFVLNWKIQINKSFSTFLRNCSILVYLTHIPILFLLKTYTPLSTGGFMLLFTVFSCSMILSTFIQLASKRIPLLRYLY